MISDADIDALYAAVYTNPDDDGRRLVLSDALIEKGDPRGEFIALQFGRSIGRFGGQQKEQKLLRRFRAAWLGPLAKCAAFPVFERGFLAQCAVLEREGLAPIGAREWSTVRVLDASKAKSTSTLVLSHPIRSWTRKIIGVDRQAAIDIFASTETCRFRELALKIFDVNRFVEAFAGCTNMPELRTVELTFTKVLGMDGARRMFQSPLTGRLDEITVTVSREDDAENDSALFISGAVAELVAKDHPPARVILTGSAGTLRIDFRGEHAGRIVVSNIHRSEIMAMALRAFAGKALREVCLLETTGYPYTVAPTSSELRAAAEAAGPTIIKSIP